MMTLLWGLHSIAAQRGDGLRSELLRIDVRGPKWPGAKKMHSAAIVEDIGG